MLDTRRRWTVQEVLALPYDGNRYEVVHGELLVTPSPNTRHEVVRTRLISALIRYVEDAGFRDQLFVQSDVFDADDVYVQPDLVVVDPSFSRREWRDLKRPLLVVEIVSPSSRRGDRMVKRPAYQALGAATYWIVDPDDKRVEVWHPGDTAPETPPDVLRWRVAPAVPEIDIRLDQLFANLPD